MTPNLIKRTMALLHEVERHASTLEQHDAGEYHGIEDYLETLHSSRTSPPLHSFATREEADT